MKSVLVTLFVTMGLNLSAQNVGINTNTPEATLQVVGAPNSNSIPDGIIPPSLTGEQLKAKDAVYTATQTGAIVYVTAAAAPVTPKTVGVTAPGFYYFDGAVWQSLQPGSRFGDVKTGIQATDHSGWVKLDGRTIASLTPSQQTRAAAIGLSGNLPNANNTALLQNGTALGSVSGSMSKTIARNQLPNVTLDGTTASNGNHRHSLYHVPTGTGGFPAGTVNAFKHITSPTYEGDVATTDRTSGGEYKSTNVLESTGAHTHGFTTSSLNGGTTQQTLDITPRSLSVNIFIYLGL